MSDCCLTLNEQFSAISWREQVTFDEIVIPLSQIGILFIVMAH